MSPDNESLLKTIQRLLVARKITHEDISKWRNEKEESVLMNLVTGKETRKDRAKARFDDECDGKSECLLAEQKEQKRKKKGNTVQTAKQERQIKLLSQLNQVY